MVHSSKQGGIGTFRIFKGLSHGHSGVSALKSQLRKARSVCGSAVRFGGSCQVGNPGIRLIIRALKCGIRLFDRALICGWYPN